MNIKWLEPTNGNLLESDMNFEKDEKKERLEQDFLKICDQIGIHTVERPLLTFEKEEFLQVASNFGDPDPDLNETKGILFREGNIIFINTGLMSVRNIIPVSYSIRWDRRELKQKSSTQPVIRWDRREL